jgi:hypothetical protein
MTFPSSLAVIINFCSNDYPFLRPCIEAVKPFAAQILIPVCDHFFDGQEEDRVTLEAIYAEHPDVQFIEFPFDGQKSFYASHSSVYGHNLARLVGSYFLREKVEYVLFLDCDEIVDTPRFIDWLNAFPLLEYRALHFLTYWYFRESRFQARNWEHTPLLIHKSLLDGALIMNEQERAGMYDSCLGKKASRIPGRDHLPMFHHYSWVRTPEQMLRKVRCWGHHWQRDWESQVLEEFSHPFTGTDFVHGYEFREVSPYIHLDLLQKPQPQSDSCSSIKKLTHQQLVQIDLELTFKINFKSNFKI